MKKKTLLIGLTGGIGAGKSTVAVTLGRMGYPILSADTLAREVTAANSPAVAEIRSAFGDEAILSNGTLNRPYIREQMLEDASLRKRLEEITHPKIQKLSQQKSEELFAKGAKIVFYEAPLLFEAKSEKGMDAVICVWAKDEIRIRRIMNRDHTDRSAAEKIIKSQLAQEEKMRRADFLLENNDGSKTLLENTEKILEVINKKFIASEPS